MFRMHLTCTPYFQLLLKNCTRHECYLSTHMQIASRYRLKTSQILLSLRGFYLTPDTPITFLRDGDIIVVTADNKLEVRIKNCLLCKFI